MKFVDSHTCPTTRKSYAAIRYKGKDYKGFAKCHPDDEWSEYIGCMIAEMRAEIAALKEEYKKKKQSCEECRKFVVAVTQYAKFDKTSPSAKAMFRQLNRRIKEVNKIAEAINRREFELRLKLNQKEYINKKYSKSKEVNK